MYIKDNRGNVVSNKLGAVNILSARTIVFLSISSALWTFHVINDCACLIHEKSFPFQW